MTEFELIRAYFASPGMTRPDVRVGVGDDAALVRPAPGTETVVTTDVLVAGVHFFEDVDPAALGYKALAVNLSDLAAMGAGPAWFLLDLTLPPTVSAAWLERFAQGLLALAAEHGVQLIGGDTSRGPLAIAITAMGSVPEGEALLRGGARAGDVVYVTGTLGDAALALAERRGERRLAPEASAAVRARLERPEPRVAAGVALRGIASSAIDVSDGLLADLGHILQASGTGAKIDLAALPLSPAYRNLLTDAGWDYALSGGDDYELCFTVPQSKRAALEAVAARSAVPLTAIGEVTAGSGIEVYDAGGRVYRPRRGGYQHFEEQRQDTRGKIQDRR